MEIFDISPGLIVWSFLTVAMIAAPAVVGGVLADRRRRSWALGAALGLLLNWIGVIIVALATGVPREPGSD